MLTDLNLWFGLHSRSTARLSTGQRTALNDVEDVHAEDRDGQAFYVYEHLSQVRGNLKRLMSVS